MKAEPYIAAAVAGLAAHPRVHDPDEIAARAVTIGLAVAKRVAEIELEYERSRGVTAGEMTPEGPRVTKAKGRG